MDTATIQRKGVEKPGNSIIDYDRKSLKTTLKFEQNQINCRKVRRSNLIHVESESVLKSVSEIG